MQSAGYVRVSSGSQDNAMQRDAIEVAARARQHTIGRWYADTISGSLTRRPELDALRRDVHAGHVRRVYVWRLDRLSRAGIRDTLSIVAEFREAGAELLTVADGFTLVDGPQSEVVLAVLAWAAQMERLAIGERIAAARERAAARGEGWGRPPRMQPFDVRKARELQDAGKSVRHIAMAMHVPKTTVARALSRKTLALMALRKAGSQGSEGGASR
jgi:DNA invertase Pin-like site-specific DNA recombinase